MKTALTRDNLGIVLNMEPDRAGADDMPFSAHLILNDCRIDDDGNICLTAPAGLLGVLDLVDRLKAELDGLANEAVLWLARGIAARGPRAENIANDNGWGMTGADGGGERVGRDAPPPLSLPAPMKLARPPGDFPPKDMT